MNKKTIYLVVAVLVVVIVVGVAAYVLMNQGGGSTTTPTPTPPPATPVSEASSLQFSVNQTTDDVLVGYTYSCKNFNASDEKLRVDMCLTEGNYSYIIDLGTQKSYASMDGGATWSETNFADDCTNYVTPFHNIVDKLIANGDTADDYSYTESGSTYDVYCIAVNPTLADSLFTAS